MIELIIDIIKHHIKADQLKDSKADEKQGQVNSIHHLNYSYYLTIFIFT